MIGQNSSGGTKLLIILTGLVFAAAVAFGVVWSTQFIKHNSQKVQKPVATRIKIPKSPGSKTMKIPQAAPPIKAPQSSLEPAPPQSETSPGSGPASLQDIMPAESIVPATRDPEETVFPDSAAIGRNVAEQSAPAPEDISLAKTDDVIAVRDEATDAAASVDDQAPPDSSAKTAPSTEPSQKDDQTPVEPTSTTGSSEEPKPQPATVQSTPIVKTAAFNLQIGAYRMHEYAHDAVTKLSGKGYDPFILEIIDARQRTWYTVRIGRFDTRKKAVASLDQFLQKENITAVIAKAGQL